MKHLIPFLLLTLFSCCGLSSYASDLGTQPKLQDNVNKPFPSDRSFLSGQWEGYIEVQADLGSWYQSKLDMTGQQLIDGCALIDFREFEKGSSYSHAFSVRTFLGEDEEWDIFQLDNNVDDKMGLLQTAYQMGHSSTHSKLNPEKSLIEANWMVIIDNQIRYEVFESYDQGENWVMVARAHLQKSAH